jgi:hypothetical protein
MHNSILIELLTYLESQQNGRCLGRSGYRKLKHCLAASMADAVVSCTGLVWCGARGCVKMNAEFLDERYDFWNGR